MNSQQGFAKGQVMELSSLGPWMSSQQPRARSQQVPNKTNLEGMADTPWSRT